MKEYAKLDSESEAYKTLRRSLAVASLTTRGGDSPSEEVAELLESHAKHLDASGERLLKQFETSWAGNDFRQAASLNLLGEAIGEVRKVEDLNKKTALQGFFAVAYAMVTDDRKMRPEARETWKKLTGKILEEQSEVLQTEYEGSDLSQLKAGDFDHVAIDGLVESYREEFENFKKITWLLTK